VSPTCITGSSAELVATQLHSVYPATAQVTHETSPDFHDHLTAIANAPAVRYVHPLDGPSCSGTVAGVPVDPDTVMHGASVTNQMVHVPPGP
jgi:hypothetical protein